MTESIVRLEHVATLTASPTADYALTTASGLTLPPTLVERIGPFLETADRRGLTGVLGVRERDDFYIARLFAQNRDSLGRPTRAVRVDATHWPADPLRLAWCCARNPVLPARPGTHVEIPVPLPATAPRTVPLAHPARARLVFGLPVAVSASQGAEAMELVGLRYDGFVLSLGSEGAWPWQQWMDGLVGVHVAPPPPSSDDAPLAALCQSFGPQDALWQSLAGEATEVSRALMRWWSLGGALPSRNLAAVTLWLARHAATTGVRDRLEQARAAFGQLAELPDAVGRFAFQGLSERACNILRTRIHPSHTDIDAWHELRDLDLCDEAGLDLSGAALLAALDTKFVELAVERVVRMGGDDRIARALLGGAPADDDASRDPQVWERTVGLLAKARAAPPGGLVVSVLSLAARGLVNWRLALDLAAVARAAGASGVASDAAYALVADLVASGALESDAQASEELLRALHVPEGGVDWLVAQLARETWLPEPPLDLPLGLWGRLLPVVEAGAVVRALVNRPSDTRSLERLVVQVLGACSVSPMPPPPLRYRERHAAFCTDLARLPGWSAWGVDRSARVAYVERAASEVGLYRDVRVLGASRETP